MSNPVETGAQTVLAYVQEVGFKQTPATPVGQVLRTIPGSIIGTERSFVKNPELRTDNMTQAGAPGGMRGKGAIPGKLSYGTFDDLFAGALGKAAWAANVIKVEPLVSTGGISMAVDSTAKTFTRTVGSFVTDGFAVGQIVQASGFTNAGNNTAMVVTAVTATVLTASNATGLATEAAAAGRTLTVLRPTFTIERQHKNNGIFFGFTGCVVDGFTLSGKVNEPVDVSFDIIAGAVLQESATSLFSTLVAANNNDLINTWSGSVKKNGVAMGDLVSWQIKVARNSDSAEVCGSPDLYDIQHKQATITGTAEIYFDDEGHYTDFRLQNDTAFQINLGPGASKSYQIDMGRCRITKWTAEPKDGMMTASIEWEADVPLTGTDTSIKITRFQ